MLYNRQQANFGTYYVVERAYSLEQQNSGRAHARLCHASSYVCAAGSQLGFRQRSQFEETQTKPIFFFMFTKTEVYNNVMFTARVASNTPIS